MYCGPMSSSALAWPTVVRPVRSTKLRMGRPLRGEGASAIGAAVSLGAVVEGRVGAGPDGRPGALLWDVLWDVLCDVLERVLGEDGGGKFMA